MGLAAMQKSELLEQVLRPKPYFHGLKEPLQNPLSALASHHQVGYFVQKTHQNARYGSFFSLVSHPDG